ncbi:MAG: HNH endonuclease [Acidobacteriia bacterium]|nr:HNH endonuclease [Terriglobia bacterium]
MACMFCRSEVDLTREHVFPAFMGGELTVPDGSCNRCNGEFGKWESAIRDSTRFLLNLLQIENRNGEVPTARVEVEIRGMDVKGLFGKREADGTISLSDVVVPDVESDGKKHRRGFFVSKASAERFIERSRARGEKTTELSMPEEIVFDASYTQTLPFIFTLEARKVAAKIALASIAYKCGVPFALSPQFDALRQVRTAKTEKEMPLRVFCNKTFIAAHARNAHQHSVMCYLSAGKKKGWALVTLFGGLSYVVEVTGNYEERSSRLFSIFYDAAAKKPLSPVVLADEMTIIGEVLSKNSIFEDRDAIDEQWFPILAAYCADAGIELERIPPESSPPAASA